MYNTLLFAHSWLRWIVLVLFVIVIVSSIQGLGGGKDYTKTNKSLAASLMGSLHLQLLLGLLLYFFYSPITTTALKNMKLAMKVADVRYWAVEHITVMILAVVIAQIGSISVKKSSVSKKKFRLQLIFFGIALLLILSRIPWTDGRLFRL